MHVTRLHRVSEAKKCSMKYFKPVFFSFIAFLLSYVSPAQQTPAYPGFHEEITKRIEIDSSSKLHISAILVNGNRKTKTYIILRELQFKTGDSIPAATLFEQLQQSRALVYNTSLFSEVEIVPAMISATEIVIKITVLEKLYIYPIPQFRLVDRNLNEWIKTYHADLERVIYGAKFEHYNLSGRGDKLRIYLLNGYARAVTFNYSAPYSNGALTEGFSFSGGYTENREFTYKTDLDNSLMEFKKTGFTKTQFNIGGTYQRRRGYFKRNTYSISYNYLKVNDSAILPKYNPHYFNLNKPFVGFTDIQYSYLYSNTNNVNYPLKGKIFNAGILKRGFGFSGGINMLALDGKFALFIDHKKNWYSSIETFAKLKLPLKQPYINQAAVGYGEFYLRGLEYYVVDGVAAALVKYTLRKKLVSFDIPFPFRIKKIPKIPFTFYAKTFTDIGYIYNKKEFDTRLGNTLLYTGGFGLDILSIYDSTLKLEYSFNQLGENGLFLHIRSGF